MPDKKFFKDILGITIILSLSLYLYRDIIFAKGMIISSLGSDTLNYNYSFYYLTFGLNNAHHPNLWNPYISLGESLIGHPANALFYPLNLIFFFLPLAMAINYSFLLNTVFLGTVVYLYIRYLNQSRFSALVAAIIFIFSGLVLLHTYAGHISTMQTLPWLVLVFLFAQMCIQNNTFIPAILGGLALGIQILAGNAQYSFYTVVAVSSYFLFQAFWDYAKNKDSGRLVFLLSSCSVLILVGLGIAAIKLIPSLEFIRLSDRNFPDLSFASSWSFPAQNLITYILPGFYGDTLHLPYWGGGIFWEMCGYVGILPLVLSIIAVIHNRNRNAIFFTGLALVALLGSLGYMPLFKIFYYFLPAFNKFRGHSKLLMLFTFSVSVLSAYGLDWILDKKTKEEKNQLKPTLWSLGIVSGLVLAFAFLLKLNNGLALSWWVQLLKSKHWPLYFSQAAFGVAKAGVLSFSFFITAGFCVLLLWANKMIRLRLFQFLILILIVSDLWSFGSRYVVFQNPKDCYWDRGIIRFLKDKGQPCTYRLISPKLKGPFPNKALLDGLCMIDGYDAVFLSRYLDFFSLFPLGSLDSKPNLKLLSLCNLKFLIMPKNEKLNNSSLSIAYQADNVTAWLNSGCLPRAYIVHGARTIADRKDRVAEILFDEHFDPLSTVILEEPVAANIPQSLAQQPGESVEFLKYGDDEVIIRVLLKSDGYLVLSDYNYPGWKAEILNLGTGEHKEIIPLYANYLFRAVALNKGQYSVRFIFEPQSFHAGLKITILTIIIAGLCLVWLRLKKFKSQL